MKIKLNLLQSAIIINENIFLSSEKIQRVEFQKLLKSSKVSKATKGRIILSSKCVVCNNKRLIKKQKDSGLFSSLGIKTTLIKIPLLYTKMKKYCVSWKKFSPNTRQMFKKLRKDRVYLVANYVICCHRKYRFVKFNHTKPGNCPGNLW